MQWSELDGKVALITGGSNGIGAAVGRRLAGTGAHVVLADIDDDRGRPLADELDGLFVHCDVTRPEHSEAAVAAARARFGSLDLIHLNAGVTSGCTVGDGFSLEGYRRAMAINLDGVVFGLQAALPALRETGGQAVVTASLAGLLAVPMDPFYAANKHALVGLVRSLGPPFAEQGLRINALCPGFADTAIVDGIRQLLDSVGIPLIEVPAVVEAFVAVVESETSGSCWFVQPGRPSAPFEFRNVPGPR